MDNKQFPEQEENVLLPQLADPAPPLLEVVEDTPVIEELAFSQPEVILPEPEEEIPEPIAEPLPECPDALLSEEPDIAEGVVAADIPEGAGITSLFEETQASNLLVAATMPAESGISFLEHIPDLDADSPVSPVDETIPVDDATDISTLESSAEDTPSEELIPAQMSAEVPSEEGTPDQVPAEIHAQEITPAETALTEAEDPALEILNDPTLQPVSAQETPPVEDVDDQAYSDAPAPAEEAAPKDPSERITRKGRPKRKKGEGLFGIPNILATAVWMVLILFAGVTLGRMMWMCASDVLAFGRPDQKVTVTVYESDSTETIIDKLYANNLIRYKGLFKFYAELSDAEEDIKPGIYDLNTRYDYHALVKSMAPSSTRSVVEVTIPEGYTCRQIFALLEENRVCTAVDIGAYAAKGNLHNYWFLEDVERGSEYCLEGFLFPDTYQFYKNSSPREALEKMLNNFEKRFSEEMIAQIDALNANVTGGGYGVREIVIVASLIEKESAAPSESPMIASVIYNRLHNWEYPALLNIDAAIIYAQGGERQTIDTSIDSPYNTYRYTGLTPTPIANPGLASLKAALNPEHSNYYFYVLNPATGKHQFSTTQAEHDHWISEFYGNNAG